MLDYMIYLGAGITLIAFLFSVTKKTAIGYFLGAVLSVIITIGIFSSGWQSYWPTNVTITTTGPTQTLTSNLTTIMPLLTGTPEQQTIFLIASVSAVISLLFAFSGLTERRKNIASGVRA